MKIELDLSLLEETTLTPDDFIYLYIFHKRAYGYLEKVNLNVSPGLEKDGWIVVGDRAEPTEYIVTQKFRDLFIGDGDDMFAELCEAYPFKVESPTRGVRVLHAKDPKAASNKKARNKYKKVLANRPHHHRYIMKCLQLQLEHEKDNLGYLQNLETWINNHTWEKYENMNINDIKDDRRITRQL